MLRGNSLASFLPKVPPKAVCLAAKLPSCTPTHSDRPRSGPRRQADHSILMCPGHTAPGVEASRSEAETPAPSPAAKQSDGVFDTPSCVSAHRDDLSSKVSAVSAAWKWAMIDEKTLGIFIPQDQDPLAVSKEKFVSLLEFVEEELGLDRVVAIFKKTGTVLDQGFPKTLRYIGFRVLSPDKMPENVDPFHNFAMAYVI